MDDIEWTNMKNTWTSLSGRTCGDRISRWTNLSGRIVIDRIFKWTNCMGGRK
jgi:hypothetical protein